MTEKKIIAVLGATGAQGSGLINAMLRENNSEYSIRAITRDVKSEKARSLAAKGIEVVAGDLDKPETIEKAFKGAYGAYCVTFFWEHYSAEKEKTHAKVIAESLKKAGVKHAVWSTLEDTRKFIPLTDNRMPTLQGNYKVPHFDAKEEANQYFIDSGVPTTFLYTAFYWENFIYFGAGPQRGPDGKLYLTFPLGDKLLPGLASEDIGKTAWEIFKRGDEFKNKKVFIAGEHLTGKQFAEKMSRALNQEIIYNDIDPDVYRSFPFPGADEMGNMIQFKRDFNDYYVGVRDIEKARKLNPELLTFDQWLNKNASKIVIPEPQKVNA